MENNCQCQNGYNEETFLESFGKDNDDIKKCNNCPNMTFEDGIMTCTKFCK